MDFEGKTETPVENFHRQKMCAHTKKKEQFQPSKLSHSNLTLTLKNKSIRTKKCEFECECGGAPKK